MTGQCDRLRFERRPLVQFIGINSIAALAVRILRPGAVFSRLQDSGSARCQPETAAAARSVRNASNRVFRAVQIFLCCIRVSTARAFSMGVSGYQCDEPDVFDLANDSIAANSASLQPLEAKLRRSPETPGISGCFDTFRNVVRDFRLPSVIDSSRILLGTIIQINPPSRHRSQYRNVSDGRRASPIFP